MNTRLTIVALLSVVSWLTPLNAETIGSATNVFVTNGIRSCMKRRIGLNTSEIETLKTLAANHGYQRRVGFSELRAAYED